MFGSRMRHYSLLKVLSLLAYLAIIFPGEKLAMPLILVLVLGLFAPLNEPVYFLCIVLADVALIVQCVWLFSKPKIRARDTEAFIFVCLLLPVLAALPDLSVYGVMHPLFYIPTSCFVVLYSLSLYYSFYTMKKETA